MKPQLLGAVSACAFALGFSSANATIVQSLGARDLDGNSSTIEAYYDPNLNITWAANQRIVFGTWDEQVAWAANVIIGGVGGWRLPSSDVNSDGIVVNCMGGGRPGCEDNEMGFLFNEEGIGWQTPAPFNKVSVNVFWSGTEYAPNPGPLAWIGDFALGSMNFTSKQDIAFAWAVYDGDVGIAVSSVPVPAAVWLFGSGLVGLLGVVSRKVV